MIDGKEVARRVTELQRMERTSISLEVGHDYEACAKFGYPLHKQLTEGRYSICSAMPIPSELGEWRDEHRTARKRADRCSRRGYRFVMVRPHERVDELFAINTSMPERQGRPMSEGYLKPPSFDPNESYPCARHAVRRYGVEAEDGTLVAYLWLYRAGELALVSQILGHAGHLENEVMYLLWQGMVLHESAEPGGFIVYNRHDSGTDGLRFYKERVGLTETRVAWSL